MKTISNIWFLGFKTVGLVTFDLVYLHPMMRRYVFCGLVSLCLSLLANGQPACGVTAFTWTQGQATAKTVVKCSDSNQDHEWTLTLDSQDWELSVSILAGMPLATRYETYYELALARGTFESLVAQARQELELSDLDLVVLLVDLVREVPYSETFGGEQTPETTMAGGKGDCSDKSLLLATLLGEVGIETSLVLDESNEHAFLAFPASADSYYKLETTNPNTIIFEEYAPSAEQVLVPLSPGAKVSERRVEILNEVLAWQWDKSAQYGSRFVFGDCQVRRSLEAMAVLQVQRDSVGSRINDLELAIQPLERQLTPLYDERNAEVDDYNSLTEKINELVDSLNDSTKGQD